MSRKAHFGPSVENVDYVCFSRDRPYVQVLLMFRGKGAADAVSMHHIVLG